MPDSPDARFRHGVQRLGLLLSGDEDALFHELSSNKEAPGEFLEFLDQQKLRHQFAVWMENSRLRDLFEPAALAERDRTLAAQRQRQRNLVEQLGWLDALLGSAAIEYRLIKGPSLALRFFGGVENRHFGDLDILIPRARLADVHQTLLAAGVTRRSRSILGLSLATRFAHGWDYVRGKLRLDLHWALATHFSYRIDMPRIWKEEQTLDIEDRRIAILSDESALLFLSVSFFEDLDRGAGVLKSVVDLDAMLRAMDGRTDWSAFFARAEAERIQAIVRAILRLVLDLGRGESRCPALARELARKPTGAPDDWAGRRALLEGRRGRFSNKLWAAQLYACGRSAALAWWGFSLPFRLAAYDPRFLRRFFGRVS